MKQQCNEQIMCDNNYHAWKCRLKCQMSGENKITHCYQTDGRDYYGRNRGRIPARLLSIYLK